MGGGRGWGPCTRGARAADGARWPYFPLLFLFSQKFHENINIPTTEVSVFGGGGGQMVTDPWLQTTLLMAARCYSVCSLGLWFLVMRGVFVCGIVCSRCEYVVLVCLSQSVSFLPLYKITTLSLFWFFCFCFSLFTSTIILRGSVVKYSYLNSLIIFLF